MEGSGKMVVAAVGINSQAGIIFALLGAAEETKHAKKSGSDFFILQVHYIMLLLLLSSVITYSFYFRLYQMPYLVT